MQALGEECLDTKRFDTEVPGLFRLAMEYKSLDYADKRRAWKRLSRAR